jgi:predicted ATPase
MLFQKKSPSVVCIEEPELGLHPDAVNLIAELLISASKKMQLIVTTHSDTLVSALSEQAESVIVCDRLMGRSRLQRIEHDKISWWLEKYKLGDIWRMGEIGGNP